MTRFRWLFFISIAAILLGGCSSNNSNTAINTDIPGGVMIADVPVEEDGQPPFRLSEGVEQQPESVPVPVAEATPLTEQEVDQILVRLPAIQTETADIQEFALPEESLPPPLTGETIEAPFPPAEAAAPPEEVPSGPLEVLRFSPEGDVPIVPNLSVTFSQPMVPLSSHKELSAQDVPVILTPDVPGHWRWVGTKTLFFEADVEGIDRFPMATEYTVTIPAGTKSATGSELAKEVRWSFRTPPPTLQTRYPTGGPQRLDPLMFVSFDQRIDPAAVLETIHVTAGGESFPVRMATEEEIQADKTMSRIIAGAQEGRWVAFRATRAFPSNTTVTVNVGPNTPSAEGPLVTDEVQSFTFQTYGPLLVVEVGCSYSPDQCSPFTPWFVRFTNPIDTAKFDASMIQVSPELPDMRVEIFGNTISIRGATKGRTTYQVTLSADIPDIFGQTLGKDQTFRIEVGPAEPFMTVNGGDLVVLDPSGPPTYSVFTVNIDRIKVQGYAVEPEDYPAFLEYGQGFYRNEKGVNPPGKLVMSETIRVKGAEDVLVETPIDLAAALPRGKGHVVLILEPEQGPISSLFNRRVSDFSRRVWVQATNIGLDAFVDNDQMVAWANDLETGAPLNGVEMQLWPTSISGTTEDNGVVTLPLPGVTSETANMLIARKDGDTAFLTQGRYYYLESGWRQRPSAQEARWYVFDDRQMYRPGEDVHVKGWIRSLSYGPTGDVDLLPPGGNPRVAYSVMDPFGNEVATGEATLSKLGGFDLSFTLPENINLGYANINFTLRGALLGGQYNHSFQVQEFRRPEFEVKTSVSEGPHLVGGFAIATVKASYFAGGPLPNAEVNWYVTSSPGTYRPPNWDDFTFGRWIPWWRFYGEPMGNFAEDSFSSRTDASGEHHLRIDFEPMDPPQPVNIRAEATVFDVNRQAWTSGANLLVHPSELYVGLRTKRFFVQQGQPMDVDVIVTDIDGNAVADRPVTVKAARLEWMFRADTWQEEEVDVQTCEVTSAETPVTCTFETPKGGSYRITATVEDEQGRPNLTEMTRWVSGGHRPPSRNVEQEEITLIPDKESYQPGDVAEILVQAPFYPAEGMVTLRRDGLVSTERFTMDEPTYTVRVPIEDSYTPNIYVQVDLVGAAGRVDATGRVNESLPKRPAYAVGSLNLPIPPLSRTLSVQAAPRANKLEPGGNTIIDVTVKDAAGQPVPDAELAVVVVDEAILALSNYQLTDPIAVFYSGRGPGVEDIHNRADILLANPDLLSELAAATEMQMTRSVVMPSAAPAAEEAPAFDAMAEPAAPGQAPTPIQVRTNFNPLALFAPEEHTDAAGQAHVEVTVPDNLTRYRVMVVAVADGKFFGSGESSITARLPLMVRPSAPRFLNFGDQFELPIVIQNQTDEDMTVDVATRSANLVLMGGPDPHAQGKRVLVPANDRVEVRFPAMTESAGTARIQIGATSGSRADAAEVSLPVWTPATTEAFAVYGEIDDGAIMQPVLPPEDVIPGFGALEISTSSTALQALTDAYLYLVSYPFECSEQLASRVLGVAALRDVLTAFDAPGLPAPAEVTAAVERDIQRLQTMQNYDGGFPIWRRGDESWPFYSVHAAHALVRAQQKGFEVPEDMLFRSLDYLRNIEQYIPSWYSQKARNSLIAYSLYVRKLAGDIDPARARQLVNSQGLDNLSMESIGWLLYTMTGDPGSEKELESMRRYLNNRVTETAGAANFVDTYGDGDYLLLYSNRRADGIILEALIEDQPDSDLIPKLVRGLLGHRSRGRWSNTQENVFILLSLDRYFNVFEAQTPDFVARMWLGDQYVGGHGFQGRTTERFNVDVPMNFLLDAGDGVPGDGQIGHEQVPVIVQKDGPGRLYYRLGLRYAPTDLVLDPADYGFEVMRFYEAVDDPGDVTQDEDGVWHVKAGARVRVRLMMVVRSRRYHVALVDPLPAGFEAVNPALAVTGTLPQDPQSQSNRYGWWWWGPWYEHQNLRDERAEAFASLVWEGVHTYTYIARATTPGQFIVPPAKAEEMYAPETFGRSGSDRVIVE